MGKHEILPKRLDELIVGDSACVFRINVDVLNEAFGIGRAMYARGGYPDKQNTWIAGNKAEDKFFIWMPKLYGNSSEWQNSISEDGSEIYEIAEPTRNEDWTDTATYSTYQRIVFVKESPKAPYRFVGVFENDSMEHLKHSYRRIATKVKLVGNPVYKIELLDDNRSMAEEIQRRLEEERKHEAMVHQMNAHAVAKVSIDSDTLCYGPEPEIGAEIGQKLTISENGKVQLVHIYYARDCEKQNSKTDEWEIDRKAVIAIYEKAFTGFLDFTEPPCTDVGSWCLEVQFNNGMIMKRVCSAGMEPSGFTSYLRRKLGRTDIVGCK